jgi:hypothetical protein
VRPIKKRNSILEKISGAFKNMKDKIKTKSNNMKEKIYNKFFARQGSDIA